MTTPQDDGRDYSPIPPDRAAGCEECFAWLPDPGGRYAWASTCDYVHDRGGPYKWTSTCDYVHCPCVCHPEPMGRRT